MDPSTDKYKLTEHEYGWIGPVPKTYQEDLELRGIVENALKNGVRIMSTSITEYLYMDEDNYGDELPEFEDTEKPPGT